MLSGLVRWAAVAWILFGWGAGGRTPFTLESLEKDGIHGTTLLDGCLRRRLGVWLPR